MHVCGHALAVVETNGELRFFCGGILRLHRPSPNITVSETEGLSKGRAGQKSCCSKQQQQQQKTRSKQQQRYTQTFANIMSQANADQVNIGASASQINYNVLFLALPVSPSDTVNRNVQRILQRGFPHAQVCTVYAMCTGQASPTVRYSYSSYVRPQIYLHTYTHVYYCSCTCMLV